MNDLYLHQLETENKQLRIALQECRKALEEQQQKIDKAIEYIKSNDLYFQDIDYDYEGNIVLRPATDEYAKEYLLEILGDKENEI